MTRTDYSAASRVTLALYVVELGLVAITFSVYKTDAVLSSHAAKFIVLALIGAALAAIGIAAIFKARRQNARTLGLGVGANLISLAIGFSIVEVALRLLERSSIEGITVAGIPIRPTWPELLDQIRTMPPRSETYFTYDPDLGWTVGPNRQAAAGLYFSSAEGIRSAAPGVSYADDAPAHRIALVGDSNAFSLEVPFGDSWGHRLELLLGPGVQVLNFGVDGYGIDQIYLRYLRDVRPWKPAVVVIGFIQHDLMRSMAVYPFISFGWPRYLTKPRFDLIDDRLHVVNRPIPSPEEIMHATSPRDLPFADYDPGFVNQEWDWRFDGGPLLLRVLTSISPRWPENRARGAADTQTLNSRLLIELVTSIQHDGARAVLVYLPHWSGDNGLAKGTLEASRLPYMDMTECLLAVPKDQRHVPSGAHYTGMGNDALARCTAARVRCGIGGACPPT